MVSKNTGFYQILIIFYQTDIFETHQKQIVKIKLEWTMGLRAGTNLYDYTRSVNPYFGLDHATIGPKWSSFRVLERFNTRKRFSYNNEQSVPIIMGIRWRLLSSLFQAELFRKYDFIVSQLKDLTPKTTFLLVYHFLPSRFQFGKNQQHCSNF